MTDERVNDIGRCIFDANRSPRGQLNQAVILLYILEVLFAWFMDVRAERRSQINEQARMMR